MNVQTIDDEIKIKDINMYRYSFIRPTTNDTKKQERMKWDACAIKQRACANSIKPKKKKLEEIH